MKAAALVRPGEIETVDVPEPECGPDQVLVRMWGVGLCGSDLGVHAGTRPVPHMPWVLGHEGVGEIVDVGAAVRDRRIGQRVAIEPNYCCLRCPPCRAGFTSACSNRVIVGMNVPGLPWADHPAGFWFVELGMTTLVVAALLMARKRRWL